MTTARVNVALTFAAPGGLVDDVTASATTGRKLGGIVLRYGTYGLTSKGRLKVKPGALTFPPDLGVVKLTREHDRQAVRGFLESITDDGRQLRVTASVSDGPEGDEAVREAQGRIREGLSFDIVDATIVGDTITAGRVVAIGQVGVPAYDDGRIDQIAANLSTEGITMLTPEQNARLAELAVMTSRSTEEEAELNALLAVLTGTVVGEEATASAQAPAAAGTQPPAAGGNQVAASMSPVGPGIPVPGGSSSTSVRETGPQALRRMIENVTAAFSNKENRVGAITAALQDITNTAHNDNIEQPAWSGELWSGLQYEPRWSDLFNSGPLTSWEGRGWRFTSKLEIQDYAGDKAEIPTDNVTTESSTYEAARMAVGVDIDRKFFDFPNQAFIESLFAQVRESWAMKLDAKIRTYATANSVAATKTVAVTITNADATVTAAAGSFTAADVGATITGTNIPASTTILSVTNSGSIELSANATATGNRTATVGVQEGSLLGAVARIVLDLETRLVGTPSWIKVNTEDWFSLLSITDQDVPAYLGLFGLTPEQFRRDPDIARGTVMGGVRNAATVRTLPGSPIRVDAQDLAHGGVDEAFFGYWAVEEHHTSGIATVKFNPAG